MKTLIHGIAVVALALSALPAAAQVPATRAGSAEALERIREQQTRMAAQTPGRGELNVASLQVGARGTPTWIDAKVKQMIDEGRMFVGLEDSRTGDGHYSTWVMVKCPTAGITDGKFWRGGQWKEVTGSEVLTVTGTTTYKTVLGDSKTVFVLEPYKPSPEEVKQEQQRQRELQEAAKAEAERRAAQAKEKKEAKAARKEAEADETAERRLAYAKRLLQDGQKMQDDRKIGLAADRLHELIDTYPDSKAAAEARRLLKEIEP
jgi:flagellar biosynthesis GTPase FlhF